MAFPKLYKKRWCPRSTARLYGYFWLLASLFAAILFYLPFMRRVRTVEAKAPLGGATTEP